MQLRAAPAAVPARAGGSSDFPLRVCEAALAAGTRSASVLGQALPLPRATPRRIVVIGDTGCRLKQAEGSYQDCNDGAAYPFATIAARAAAWQPDLVLHVGDYHYRESPCPADHPGCAGSPSGYGWDTWQADLFQPAAPLLAAAPWVVVRGNHESCTRAGVGWWRLLDPRPLLAGRDCLQAANDGIGNFSAPYAVPLGPDSQLLVLDTAATSWRGWRAGEPADLAYRAAYRQFDALSRQAHYNLGLSHHPLLGFGAERDAAGQRVIQTGDRGLQQSFGAESAALLPAAVQAMLSGHVHLWQQVSFASDHPSQFIAGFSGTAEDTTPLPADAAATVQPAPGAHIDQFSAWVGGFGFMTMEADGPGRWQITVHDRAGGVRNRCQLRGRASRCERGLLP
jgi:hypothetical protein